MASPDFRSVPLAPSYSGTPGARLRRLRTPFAILALLIGALAQGGCALSIPLESPFGNKPAAKDDVTASFTEDPYAASPMAQLSEGDLARARTAATDVLARGTSDASAAWENPETGARGTVTPVASTYQRDGLTCRDFLASYIRGDTQTWLQGDACRKSGRWEVRSMHPLNRT